MDGSPFSTSERKRTVFASFVLPCSAQYSPAPIPIGRPNAAPIVIRISVPTIALARPPPLSPTGFGSFVKKSMLIGNRHEIALSLFAPGYTMASLIANEFSEASNDLHLSALMAVGFVLFVMALIVNAIARYLVWQVARRSTGTSA